MLRRLTIRDFVIVDRLELEFRSGFGTLTGETGAGKSILLDALGLALGGRADAASVRHGCDKADIAAEFDVMPASPMRAWLSEQDIPLDEDTALLRRLVDAGGRSRGWINGVPVTLAQLREAGDWLADIHGQHAHHALLKTDTQRALLDAQANCVALAAEVAGLYREWQRVAQLRRAAEQDSASMVRQRELLEWQINELTELAFDADEWAEINAEQGRLAHASGLIGGAEDALASLDEGDGAVVAVLDRVSSRIDALVQLDPALGEARELLASAAIQADEALHALRRYRDRLELDPQRLAEIDRRISEVTDVARKHRVAPEELGELRRTWLGELEQLGARSDPARLAQQEALARSQYDEAARNLGKLRRPAAEALSRRVSEAMQTLAMSGGRFEVALEPVEGGAAHGLEDVAFLVAANPNQPLRPLAKVASGGELSRIGLAIQVMTSRDATTPTLIFDEVDVGIGGGVAEIVGKMLHRLGAERQVMCVTHLPQVAACADWQWSIAKVQRGGDVVSVVRSLDAEGRVEEIARMLGGVSITDTTRRHATEMLGMAVAPGV
ncbi:MAG: DNA repair protein RecN [Rhodocyclales bacterium]|nr:DNA repair protein RecN [Rhodocyclales bacterium]